MTTFVIRGGLGGLAGALVAALQGDPAGPEAVAGSVSAIKRLNSPGGSHRAEVGDSPSRRSRPPKDLAFWGTPTLRQLRVFAALLRGDTLTTRDIQRLTGHTSRRTAQRLMRGFERLVGDKLVVIIGSNRKRLYRLAGSTVEKRLNNIEPCFGFWLDATDV